jgi:PAS domain S-box-containing protein
MGPLAKDDQERRRAEPRDQAPASNVDGARFRIYAENSPDFIVEADLQGTIRYLNRTDGMRQRADYIGTNILDWVSPQHHTRLRATIEEVVRTGESRELEYRFLSPSQEETWHSAHLAPMLTDEDFDSLLIVIRDSTRAKQAEAALRERDERLRTFTEVAFEGIMLHQDGVVRDVNQALANMVGYEVDALIGRKIRDLVRPESMGLIHQHVASGAEERYEIQAIHADGRLLDLEVRGRNLGPELGGLRAAAVRDISNIRRTQQALRAERDRAQKYLDVAGVIIVALDLEGRVTLINQRGCQVLGWQEEDVIGESWFDHFLPEDEYKRVRDHHQRIISGGIPGEGEFENPILTKDGEERGIRWRNTPLRDACGDLIGTLSSGEDVTEQRRAEHELRMSERRYRELVENANDVIYTHNLKGNFLSANPAASRIFGYEPQEILNLNISQLVDPEYLPVANRNLEIKHLGVPATGPYELLTRCKGGDAIWVEVSTRLLTEEGDGVVLGIARDISEKKHAEGEIRQRNRELETLLNVSQRLARRFDLDDLLEAVVSAVVESLPNAESASLWLYDPAAEKMVVRAWSGHPHESIKGLSLSTDTSLVGHVFSTRQPHIVDDSRTDPFFEPVDLPDLDSVRSILGVPMLLDDEPIGVLFADNFSHWHAFGESDLRLLQSLAGHAAAAVRNARLYEAIQAELQERKRTEAALERYSSNLERANRLITSLSRVSSQFQASLDSEKIMHTLGEELRALDLTCVLGVYDPAGAQVEIVYRSFPEARIRLADRITGESTLGLRLPVDRLTPLQRVIREEVPVLFEGLFFLAAEIYPNVPRIILKQALRIVGQDKDMSSLILPLKASGQVFGVMTVWGPKLMESDIGIFSVFSGQLATALENARLFEQVRAGRERLQQVMQRLVDVQETERRHIARELHDEIGQILTGLKLTLGMAQELPSAEIGAQLTEADLQISQLLDQVRELSLDLRPSMLDDLGLHATLLWHFGRFQDRTGITVGANIHDIEDRRFDTRMETASYRIIQEALTNVARHAEVDRAEVELRALTGELRITIRDEGKGFDPKASMQDMPGNGISGMRERAIALGGLLEVFSSPGEGTQVTARLPFNGRLERRRSRTRT